MWKMSEPREVLARVPSGYTEGPWKIEGDQIKPPKGRPIIQARTTAMGWPVVFTTQENARLIALAPELVDALREAVEDIDKLTRERDTAQDILAAVERQEKGHE